MLTDFVVCSHIIGDVRINSHLPLPRADAGVDKQNNKLVNIDAIGAWPSVLFDRVNISARLMMDAERTRIAATAPKINLFTTAADEERRRHWPCIDNVRVTRKSWTDSGHSGNCV